MATLKEILQGTSASLEDVSSHLDRLEHEERIRQVVAINKSEQIRLWELAEKGEALTLEYLVPKSAKALQLFPFEGKNSLPIYTRFQKVFYRLSDGTIGGYNNSPARWLVGPGYYVAEMSWKNPKEIAVNYLKLPKEKPADLPPIKDNMSGLTRFVYGGTVDFLRWVSKDVVIGRAYKQGEKEMPNWFVLCRKIPRE
jgi:hypothetical protein